MSIKGNKFLIAGSGKSGIAACKLLLDAGKEIRIIDGNEKLDIDEIVSKNPFLDRVPFSLGQVTDELVSWADVLVLSPGVPTDLPWVLDMKKNGVYVTGELELGYAFGKGEVVAITGTNGKTTTTTLVGEIMKAFYENVDVVGNIGIPYTDMASNQKDNTVTVAEVSSFQLETTNTFHPVVSAILNITPDHLNRHHSMENYIIAKENIASNQTKEDICVLNYDSPDTRAFAEKTHATPVLFSSRNQLTDGFFYRDDKIYRAGVRKEGTGLLTGEYVSYNDNPNEAKLLMDIHDMNLVGMCNIENVMAALAISESMNVPLDIALQVIRNFKAVEHRIEFVATKRGVDYYNDSKGTNPDAAIQGIKAMTKPTILIGGGYDKGSEYDEWIEAFDNKVKLLVLIGQTKDKIAHTARNHGIENIIMADTFAECMKICIDNAVEGDAVLLSPACASWGMFDNYEQRGRIFKDMVHAISDK